MPCRRRHPVPNGGRGKKLAEAAEHWATKKSQPAVKNDLAEDLRTLGASEEDIERIVQMREQEVIDETFGIYPENWKAVEIFQFVETQWNIAIGPSCAIYTGLSYPAVASAMEWFQVPPEEQHEVARKIRVLEIKSMPILNKREDDG